MFRVRVRVRVWVRVKVGTSDQESMQHEVTGLD